MVTKEDLIGLTKYLSIIHHTPNRIRVRISSSIKDEADKYDKEMLDSLPKSIDGIKNVKVNKLVGSITINYDENIFPFDMWENLIAGDINEELMQTLQSLMEKDS